MLAFPHIPGLFVFPDYFAPDECDAVIRGSQELYFRLEPAIAGDAKIEMAHIPQPEFVRSAKHNLASEEYYTRVVLDESGERKLSCEYFPKYGEAGHALCYFRGNSNLPDFVRGKLVDRVRQTMEDVQLLKSGADATWKLTMNFYRNIGGTVAGFPFHVDIPANGIVTMILNVQREALFQIAKGDTVQDINLAIGSLLVLSGESRYEWKHRVLPMTGKQATPSGEVERISLVLGFQ